MKYITFSDLSNLDLNINNIVIMKQRYKDGEIFDFTNKPRRNDVIQYFSEGNIEFITPDEKSYFINCDSVIAAARGSRYKAVIHTENTEAHGYTISFSLSDSDGNEVCFEQLPVGINYKKRQYLPDLINDAYVSFNAHGMGILHTKSAVYRIISYISECLRNNAISQKYSAILPAIYEIEVHPDNKTNISTLASMCYMSENQFRNHFKEYTGGDTPVEYRNRLRIRKAEYILQKEDYSIEYLAKIAGFCDSCYFCRMFRKYTGYSPKTAKNHRNFVRFE